MAKGTVRLTTDGYRAVRLTLTQQSNGTVVWNMWTKQARSRWSDYQLADSGTIHQHETLTSQREALTLLVNILEERLALLSE